MLSATFLALFAVPVLFLKITKFAYGKKELAALQEKHPQVDYDHAGDGLTH